MSLYYTHYPPPPIAADTDSSVVKPFSSALAPGGGALAYNGSIGMCGP